MEFDSGVGPTCSIWSYSSLKSNAINHEARLHIRKQIAHVVLEHLQPTPETSNNVVTTYIDKDRTKPIN